MSDQYGNRQTWQDSFRESGSQSQGGYGQSGPQGPSYGQPAPQGQASPYGAPGYANASYGGGQQPPRKKKGMKRIVFGILGIIGNAIGLVAMPLIAGFVGALIAAFGAMDPDAVANPADIDAGTGRLIMVYAPTDVQADSCTIESTASDTEIDTMVTAPYEVDVDGVAYTEIAQVSVTSAATITVDCPGADTIAYGEGNAMIALITGGIGLLIPVLFGTLSLVLLIWGIIARVRS